MHTQTHISTHIHMNTHKYTWTSRLIHTHKYTHTFIHKSIHRYTYIHTIHIYKSYTYSMIYLSIYIHIYNTNIHKLLSAPQSPDNTGLSLCSTLQTNVLNEPFLLHSLFTWPTYHGCPWWRISVMWLSIPSMMYAFLSCACRDVSSFLWGSHVVLRTVCPLPRLSFSLCLFFSVLQVSSFWLLFSFSASGCQRF